MSDGFLRNLDDIKRSIADAAKNCGRAAADIRLVAVSKNQPPEKIGAALDAGVRLFGENRVQDAKARWENLKIKYPDLRLHLIGPLQTNKARDAVALFDCIETLDRENLADALAGEMKKQGKRLPCFIQVNTGDEEQKSGVSPAGLAALLQYARATAGLEIAGLMCIPPAGDPPALHFALLAKLARESGLSQLSMGMSGDYLKAIALGATHVRIGTALFGARETL